MMDNYSVKINGSVEYEKEPTTPVVQNLAEVLQQLGEALCPLVQGLVDIYETVAPYVEQFAQVLDDVSQAIAPYVKQFARYKNFVNSVTATGWLPYHTVSIDYVEKCGDNISLLEHRLSIFYTTNWDSIRQDIESRLAAYHISEEAKSTFREALSAHGMGYHRCVCRVLFPEIDREFRIHFFEDKAGSISSEKMLDKLTNNSPLENFLPREAYGWILFDQLVNHLYKPVNDGNRMKFQQDFVPNRHASTHGLVPYSSHKHSMNMIIMADYIFQILTLIANCSLPSQVINPCRT